MDLKKDCVVMAAESSRKHPNYDEPDQGALFAGREINHYGESRRNVSLKVNSSFHIVGYDDRVPNN